MSLWCCNSSLCVEEAKARPPCWGLTHKGCVFDLVILDSRRRVGDLELGERRGEGNVTVATNVCIEVNLATLPAPRRFEVVGR